MGLNAYFAFQVLQHHPPRKQRRLQVPQVVGVNGGGGIPYRTALTAVFFEGIVFVFLALTGMRQWLVRLIPATLKTATGVGIGFFLTEIGLSYSTGIGAITGGGRTTPLALGGCPLELINEQTGMCQSGHMTNPKASFRPMGEVRSWLTVVAVGCPLLRRHRLVLPNGIPRQVRPRHRHRPRLDPVLAVSRRPLPLPPTV